LSAVKIVTIWFNNYVLIKDPLDDVKLSCRRDHRTLDTMADPIVQSLLHYVCIQAVRVTTQGRHAPFSRIGASRPKAAIAIPTGKRSFNSPRFILLLPAL
jgi:hypothetical protein